MDRRSARCGWLTNIQLGASVVDSRRTHPDGLKVKIAGSGRIVGYPDITRFSSSVRLGGHSLAIAPNWQIRHLAKCA